jgi:hypothetical protein
MSAVRMSLLVVFAFGFLAAGPVRAQRAEKKPMADKATQKPADKKPEKPATEKPVPEKSKEQLLKEKDAANAKARQITITPEREAAVVSFVERNHPELAELLAHLKTNQPKEYDRALRDLFRVTEKLAMVHERDDRQYGLEIKAWKAQSRAQLLVARLKMTEPESGDAEELKKQLREALAEQMQARLDVLKLDRERVTGRLEKLNDDITRLERDRESVIDMHLKNLTNQVNANRPKAKIPEKPARK